MTDHNAQPGRTPLKVLYCRCAYAQVVPGDVKDAVLDRLCASGQAFDTVADLCEMSARRDPALKSIADAACAGDAIHVAACYERAVRGLFHAAGATLPDAGVTVHNMREQTADEIADALVGESTNSLSLPGRGPG
ncbi:MAG: hypothetical protein GC159_02565 [Phycisphaera sp.]|nr:hypothetical protein [Phycisphaera sp.]